MDALCQRKESDMKNIDTLTDEDLVLLIKSLVNVGDYDEIIIGDYNEKLHAEIIRTVLNELYCYAPVNKPDTIN
jgi:hypothetical protein